VKIPSTYGPSAQKRMPQMYLLPEQERDFEQNRLILPIYLSGKLAVLPKGAKRANFSLELVS